MILKQNFENDCSNEIYNVQVILSLLLILKISWNVLFIYLTEELKKQQIISFIWRYNFIRKQVGYICDNIKCTCLLTLEFLS